MDFQAIWDLIISNGLSALVIAVVVFAAVWLADKVGLLPNGWSKRAGVFVGTYLLSGYDPGEVEEGITLILGAILAALVNEFKNFIDERRA
jgi:hypothetical protein